MTKKIVYDLSVASERATSEGKPFEITGADMTGIPSIIEVGDNLRIERSAHPDPHGEYLYTVYRRADIKDGRHPIHGDATSETEVWMPVFTGDEETARAKLKEQEGYNA